MTKTQAEGHDEHRPDVKLYLAVFGALMALTVITVGVSYLHLPKTAALTLGIAIAVLKAGLVAAFFMHLKGEKALILALLMVTFFFVLHLMVLPTLDHSAISDKMEHTTMPPAGQTPAGEHH